MSMCIVCFFFSSRRRHTRCALVTGVQTCALPIYLEPGYPVTVNDDDAARFALDTAAQLVGPAATVEMPTPVMGAEDWSYVLQQVPGSMAFLGTRPAGIAPAEVAPNHSNRMVIEIGRAHV